MLRIRSFYDTEKAEKFSTPTNYLTAISQNEVFCGLCGEIFYINDILFDQVNRIIEKTSENPFICRDCLDEYDEFSKLH